MKILKRIIFTQIFISTSYKLNLTLYEKKGLVVKKIQLYTNILLATILLMKVFNNFINSVLYKILTSSA